MIAITFIILVTWQMLTPTVQGQYLIPFTRTEPLITSAGVFTDTGPAALAYDDTNTTCAATDGIGNKYIVNNITFTFNSEPFVLAQVYILGQVLANERAGNTTITLSWDSSPCKLVRSSSDSSSVLMYSCIADGTVLTISIAAGAKASICNILMYSYDTQWGSVGSNGERWLPINPYNVFIQSTGVFTPQGSYPLAYDNSNTTCASTDGVVNQNIAATIKFTFMRNRYRLGQVYIVAPDIVPPDMYTGSPPLTISWDGLQCTPTLPFSMTNCLGIFACYELGSILTINIAAGRQVSICNILLYKYPRWKNDTTDKPTHTEGKSGGTRILLRIIGKLLDSLKLAVRYMAGVNLTTIFKGN